MIREVIEVETCYHCGKLVTDHVCEGCGQDPDDCSCDLAEPEPDRERKAFKS